MDLNEDFAGQIVAITPSLLLSSRKSHYNTEEKVIATVTLANFCDQPLVVNKRLQMIFDYKYREAYELKFQVLGPNEQPVAPYKIIEDRLWPYPKLVDFIELVPGGQWQRDIILSEYFDFSQSGMYKVVAEYHNCHDGHQFGLDAWTGELHSPTMDVFIARKR